MYMHRELKPVYKTMSNKAGGSAIFIYDITTSEIKTSLLMETHTYCGPQGLTVSI